MTAAALAAACTTSPSSPTAEPYHGSPTATYSAEQVPGLQGWHSAGDTYQALSTDEKLSRKQSIDIAPIAKQYKSSDYGSVVSTPPGHPKDENVVDMGSAPVMEVRLDKATNSFVYQVQTPNGLDNQELYQLLTPIMRNQTILSAAFQNEDVTRIVVRLEAPPLPGVSEVDYASDEYVQEDYSTPKLGKQRTVFWFMPGTSSIDLQEMTDTVRHETIHGLTGNNNLSGSEGAPATPNPTDLAKWNAACVDMREFSLQDAAKYKQSSIDLLTQLNKEFNDPRVTTITNEIITALENGTFDCLQPQQGENQDQAFSGKVPDCVTIGPWGVLVRLMNENGLSSLINNVFSSNNEALGTTAASLHDNYQAMMEFNTIYRVLREGTYEEDSPEHILGHEMDDWDELITSTSDVCLAYPTKVAEVINELPSARKKTVLDIVNLALATLDASVPINRNPEFHALVVSRQNTINRLTG